MATCHVQANSSLQREGREHRSLPVSLSCILIGLCIVYLCVYMSMCAMECLQRSEDNLQECFFPANVQTLGIKLSSRHPWPLSHLTGPMSLHAYCQALGPLQAMKSKAFRDRSEHRPVSTAREEPCVSKAFSGGQEVTFSEKQCLGLQAPGGKSHL